MCESISRLRLRLRVRVMGRASRVMTWAMARIRDRVWLRVTRVTSG